MRSLCSSYFPLFLLKKKKNAKYSKFQPRACNHPACHCLCKKCVSWLCGWFGTVANCCCLASCDSLITHITNLGKRWNSTFKTESLPSTDYFFHTSVDCNSVFFRTLQISAGLFFAIFQDTFCNLVFTLQVRKCLVKLALMFWVGVEWPKENKQKQKTKIQLD